MWKATAKYNWCKKEKRNNVQFTRVISTWSVLGFCLIDGLIVGTKKILCVAQTIDKVKFIKQKKEKVVGFSIKMRKVKK